MATTIKPGDTAVFGGQTHIYTGSGWTTNAPGSQGVPNQTGNSQNFNYDPWAGLKSGEFNAAGYYGTMPGSAASGGGAARQTGDTTTPRPYTPGNNPNDIYGPSASPRTAGTGLGSPSPWLDPYRPPTPVVAGTGSGYDSPRTPFAQRTDGTWGPAAAGLASVLGTVFAPEPDIPSKKVTLGNVPAASPLQAPGPFAGNYSTSFLNDRLTAATSPYALNQIATGFATVDDIVNGLYGQVADWAKVNPSLAGNWEAETRDAQEKLRAWIATQPREASVQGGGAVSLSTGQPLPYAWNRVGPGYRAADDTVLQSTGIPGTGANPLASPSTTPSTTPYTAPTNYYTPPLVPPPTPTTTTPAPTDSTNGFMNLLALLLGGGTGNGYQIGTTPLGYTQYEQPAAETGGDQATMALLALLGLLGSGGARRGNLFNF